MHNEAQVILKNLFNQSSLENVFIEEISAITDQYPYFNAAQFLLAKKERSENDDLREGQHPVLFFNNPLWFEFLMQKELPVSTEVQDEMVLEKAGLETLQVETADEQNDNTGEISKSLESPDSTSTQAFNQPIAASFDSNDTGPGDQHPGVLHQLEEGNKETVSGTPQDISASDQPSKGVQQATAGLEFEPYHTIDYFASQGIRLQQSDLSKDKFGQQLKSFTEWLKSMKRIPEPQQPSQAEIHAQENVARIAEHSIESKDVYTEAMAEVWAKQGNRQKAIDIYKKLSLQNPAKSTYFAAKIEQLNS